MKRFFKISILAVATVLVLFSCQSTKKEQHRELPPAMMQARSPGIYMKFLSLKDNEDKEIALSSSQIELIKAILIDWRDSVASDTKPEETDYVKNIMEVLTKEQLIFLLTPEGPGMGMEPGENPRPPENRDGPPPTSKMKEMPGPEDPSGMKDGFLKILDKAIEDLS